MAYAQVWVGLAVSYVAIIIVMYLLMKAAKGNSNQFHEPTLRTSIQYVSSVISDQGESRVGPLISKRKLTSHCCVHRWKFIFGQATTAHRGGSLVSGGHHLEQFIQRQSGCTPLCAEVRAGAEQLPGHRSQSFE